MTAYVLGMMYDACPLRGTVLYITGRTIVLVSSAHYFLRTHTLQYDKYKHIMSVIYDNNTMCIKTHK